KICHLVDLNQDIQRPMMASTADICFGTTEHICKILKGHNDRTFKIGHGYQVPRLSSTFEFDIPGKNLKKALYVGNLSMRYIDWDLLERSANAFPEVDFVFVGPEGRSNLSSGRDKAKLNRDRLRQLDNVYFLGPINALDIPQVLGLADILLIAYQEAHHKDQAAPHKIVEYLASGRAIAATFTEEFVDAAPNLFMSRSNEDFLMQIQRALDYYPDPSRPITVPSYFQRIEEIEQCMMTLTTKFPR
ncbi:MAG: glycosyltransferase, partial [Bacteroidota bacterium]